MAATKLWMWQGALWRGRVIGTEGAKEGCSDHSSRDTRVKLPVRKDKTSQRTQVFYDNPSIFPGGDAVKGSLAPAQQQLMSCHSR